MECPAARILMAGNPSVSLQKSTTQVLTDDVELLPFFFFLRHSVPANEHSLLLSSPQKLRKRFDTDSPHMSPIVISSLPEYLLVFWAHDHSITFA